MYEGVALLGALVIILLVMVNMPLKKHAYNSIHKDLSIKMLLTIFELNVLHLKIKL
jgi:hypothetical protein